MTSETPIEPDEGVVKYINIHEHHPIPLHLMPKEEFYSVRVELFKKHWIGETIEGIGFGNLSTLCEEQQFIISGTQTGHLSNLSHEHLALVQDWNIQQNQVISCGETPPSSEAITHGTIYDSFDGVQAIIHIHQAEYWKHLLAKYPPLVSPYGTQELALEIMANQAKLNQLQIFALENHQDGVFAFGKDLRECLAVLEHNKP